MKFERAHPFNFRINVQRSRQIGKLRPTSELYTGAITWKIAPPSRPYMTTFDYCDVYKHSARILKISTRFLGSPGIAHIAHLSQNALMNLNFAT